MAATPGWRFSVTIPSWTQTALEGDELVVVCTHHPHGFSSLMSPSRGMHATGAPCTGSKGSRPPRPRTPPSTTLSSESSNTLVSSTGEKDAHSAVVVASSDRTKQFPASALIGAPEAMACTQTVLWLQFYRVEVKVLPPEEAAAPRSRSVLRRFSHFQKLYRIVRPCASWDSPTSHCLKTGDADGTQHERSECSWGRHALASSS